MALYIVRLGSFDGDGAYFRGTLDGEDVVSSFSQSHALRFRDKGMAELAAIMVGDARVVRLRRKVSTPTKGLAK